MPQAFRFELTGHDVMTAAFMRWSGLRNGVLLAAMLDAHIQVLISLDANLQYQQHVAKAGISVVVLRGESSRLHDLLKLAPEVRKALDFMQAGLVVQIPPPQPSK